MTRRKESARCFQHAFLTIEDKLQHGPSRSDLLWITESCLVSAAVPDAEGRSLRSSFQQSFCLRRHLFLLLFLHVFGLFPPSPGQLNGIQPHSLAQLIFCHLSLLTSELNTIKIRFIQWLVHDTNKCYENLPVLRQFIKTASWGQWWVILADTCNF